MNIQLLQSEYYRKAIDSIPKEHTHRDEIVSLLIDQVIDDNADTVPNRGASKS